MLQIETIMILDHLAQSFVVRYYSTEWEERSIDRNHTDIDRHNFEKALLILGMAAVETRMDYNKPENLERDIAADSNFVAGNIAVAGNFLDTADMALAFLNYMMAALNYALYNRHYHSSYLQMNKKKPQKIIKLAANSNKIKQDCIIGVSSQKFASKKQILFKKRHVIILYN